MENGIFSMSTWLEWNKSENKPVMTRITWTLCTLSFGYTFLIFACRHIFWFYTIFWCQKRFHRYEIRLIFMVNQMHCSGSTSSRRDNNNNKDQTATVSTFCSFDLWKAANRIFERWKLVRKLKLVRMNGCASHFINGRSGKLVSRSTDRSEQSAKKKR